MRLNDDLIFFSHIIIRDERSSFFVRVKSALQSCEDTKNSVHEFYCDLSDFNNDMCQYSFQRSFISKCICMHTECKGSLTTAERRIFRLARILESEGAVGTRLCRWDKLTTGPRRWDTTWIIRPSTHNCVALSGRAGSFESWYLQRARFRRNRAEIRKKRRATIAFAISRTDKTRYMYMLCSP